MSKSNRRKFIRDTVLMGLGLELIPSSLENIPVSGEKETVVFNDYYNIVFANGSFTVRKKDGSVFIKKAVSKVNIGGTKVCITGDAYEYKIETQGVDDLFSKGKKLTVYCRDKNKCIDFKTRYFLYDTIPCVMMDTECVNVSKGVKNIRSILPLLAEEETGSGIFTGNPRKILTNGPMYYDAGQICSLDEDFRESDPYGPIKGRMISPDFSYPSKRRIRSWWNTAFFSGYDKEGIVCGYLENHTGLGQVVISRGINSAINLYTETVFAPGTEISPGTKISSGRFIICEGDNPYATLETYSSMMGRLYHARTSSIINGWCSWFYTFEHVSEEEVLKNAEYISVNLRKYGLGYIQVDEGYQKWHGEWEGNDRFPHGMKWLADKIKGLDLKAGIWISPYVISEPTEVFKNHPDWLLQSANGSHMRVGPWPSEDTDWARNENPRRYGLDITHPGAQEWLYEVFNKASRDWGYEMFKIDFVAWSLLSAHHYHDKSHSPASAYRKGMEIIRDAIGPDCHINDCGPGPVTVGLTDSMRIEIDQNYGFQDAAWKQYFTDSSSSAPATAKRYYFHKKTWINDADHLCLNNLSVIQAQAAASLIALTGGNIISGDRLPDLDPRKMEILKRALPSYGETARPVDLFDTDRHRIFSLKVRKEFGEWTVVGIFNADKQNISDIKLSLSRMWIDPLKTYIVYDFWNERLLGEISGDLAIRVLPESVALLSIHEKKEQPLVISTSRHILQGAVETENIEWDEVAGIIRGVSRGCTGSFYNLTLWLPWKDNWRQDSQFLYNDKEGYSVKQTDSQILKIYLRFSDNERICWEVDAGGKK